MSDRLTTPQRGIHPMGRDAKWIEAIASLRAGFAAPVVALAHDPMDRAAGALRTALGGVERVGLIDWRAGDPRDLRDGLVDQPASTAALIVRIDPATLPMAGPSARALVPDALLFMDGIDPGTCYDTVERLGGADALVLHRDDPRHALCLTALGTFTGIRAFNFGSHRDSSVRLIDCQLYTTCSAVSAQIGREVMDLCIGAPGPDRVAAALAALAVVRALGGDVAAAAARFAGAEDAVRDVRAGGKR